ncbi:hypothetical protein [Nocardioides sp. AE5]|uniref:hypothetical protein n=1 Tax=Nocardioides sp. AE5 TaxID=2962573 RepID=UPI002880BF9D|nr:hypothetical protein [Nocardioides sp. AE5]MDT0203715.1 hypothetical protein [Nocardioides sp. AE5]
MNTTPTWQAPPPPIPPPSDNGPRAGVVALVLGLVVLLVAAVAVAIVVVSQRDSGPEFPEEWDARVADLIPIVEEHRGLEFKHPVYVDFLPEDEFRAEMTTDEGELTEEDRDELDQFTAMLRALGLIEADVDLFEQMNALSSEGTLGFFSFGDKRIRVRGSELTPAVTLTMVHELTHALQDQHFDLAARFDEFDESEDGTASSVFRGVVEGDASRVETAYFDSLTADEQTAIEESEEDEQGDIGEKLEEIPKVLLVMMGSSYALGEPLVTLAFEDGGNEAVDELFRNPPSTEEHLMDPWTWLIDEDPAAEVAKPELQDGDEEFDSGEFGALFLYLVLAERIGLNDALDAADGWGGDHYVAVTRGDQTCITADFVADTDRDLTEMDEALAAWSKEQPAGAASVTRTGDQIRLESCDTGEARLGSDSAQDALQLVAIRSQMASIWVQQGATPEQARCFSDGIIREFTVEQLVDPEFGEDDPTVTQRVQQLAMGCA